MDQYLNNRNKEILANLLANPADTGRSYTATLQQMVKDHPQSGVLQVLLACAGDKQDVRKAAAYFRPITLYKLLHNPESLRPVDSRRIWNGEGKPENYFSIPVADKREQAEGEEELKVQEEGPKAQEERVNTQETEATVAPAEPDRSTEIDDEVHEEIQDASNLIPEFYNSYTEPLKTPQTDESTEERSAEESGTIVTELYNSLEEQLLEQKEEHPDALGKGREEPDTFTNLSADNGYRPEKELYRHDDIEDEVYDEIVGIDQIGFTQTVNVLHEFQMPETITPESESPWQNTFSDDDDYPEDEEVKDERPLQHSAGVTDADINIDEEKLILGNIVSADYLMFDKKLDELRKSDNRQPAIEEVASKAPAETGKEHSTLSRYNDESLPYSFMWWLDKTRKEHADSFQPYAGKPVEQADTSAEPVIRQQRVKPVQRKAPDELQQQYYENIFSLTSVSSIERDTDKGLAFDQNKKEDIIVERFINTEPQIRPPAANRLDNENKAKRSSEDQDALVTETLARIYTDQMLYHKAIATYKKLVLKFPEKKLYFAAQIEQLEKKTN